MVTTGALLALFIAAQAGGAPLTEGPARQADRPREGADVADEAADGTQADSEDEDPSVGRFGLGVVPRINISSDDGLGLGIRGTAYWYRWGQKPYKTAIFFQAYATTRLVQHHFIGIDAIDAFNLPVRIQAEVGYYQSLSQNYCGLGNSVTCDDDTIDREIKSNDIGPVEAATFRRQFYKVRFMRPYARANFRWRLGKLPHRPEIFGGWRGHYYIPGDWVDGDGDGAPDLGAFPGSLYDRDFGASEWGMASVVQAGLMLDNRDNEPAPRQGYWLEASIRGATPFWGSRFTFGGINAIARTYVPLNRDKTLVFASRYIADVMIGDPPLQEMIRVGGSFDFTAFGGREIGRGVRVQRYPGRLKFMMQHEVRQELPDFDLLGQNIRFGLAGFLDAGTIGVDVENFGGDPFRVNLGAGVSLRMAWNKVFIMRLDVAVSPSENYVPAVYSGPNHPF